MHDDESRLAWVFDDHRPRRVARVEDAFGNALVLQRDEKGRLARVVDAVGRSVEVRTDEVGRVVGLTLDDGRAASLAYDGAGFLREVVDLVGLPNRYAYASDAIVEIRVGDDPPHVVKIEVEAGARPAVAALTDPAGGRTRYEARGGAVIVTGPDGHPWRHEVTGGRVTAVVDPEGRRTTSTFDAFGRRTSMTGADGATWTWTWDAAGRPLQATDPVGLSRTWTWDAAGDLVEKTRPDFLLGSMYHLNKKFDASTDTNSPFHKVNAVLNNAANPTPENKAAAEAAMKNADPQTMAWWAFSIPASVGERVANVTPFDFTVSTSKGVYSISQGEGLKGLLEVAGGIPIVPFLPPKAGEVGQAIEQGLDTANEVIYGGDPGNASCTVPVGPGK